MTNIDLTKIDKPFGLLDDETRASLKAYKGPVTVLTVSGWNPVIDPAYVVHLTYRAALPKLPEWPAGLHPNWKWIAMDADGYISAFDSKPTKAITVPAWETNGADRWLSELIDISFDGIPWDQAIIQRPDGV